jgi:hypothetical protein
VRRLRLRLRRRLLRLPAVALLTVEKEKAARVADVVEKDEEKAKEAEVARVAASRFFGSRYSRRGCSGAFTVIAGQRLCCC